MIHEKREKANRFHAIPGMKVIVFLDTLKAIMGLKVRCTCVSNEAKGIVPTFLWHSVHWLNFINTFSPICIYGTCNDFKKINSGEIMQM